MYVKSEMLAVLGAGIEDGIVCGGCLYDEALMRICLGRTLNLLNLSCEGLRTLVRA